MQTHLHIYTQQKSMKRWRALIHRMILKQQVKNEQIKRKQTCSVCFVKVFKLHENKFQVIQKNFQEIIIIKKNSWKSHQSQCSLHDIYGQSKAKDWQQLTIDWPLFPVLQIILVYTENSLQWRKSNINSSHLNQQQA